MFATHDLSKTNASMDRALADLGVAADKASSLLTKKIVIVAAVTLSAVAFIPSCRPVASMLIRGISLGAASIQTLQEWEETNTALKALNLFKITILGVGLTAVVLSSPALAVAALAADVAFQVMQLAVACYAQDGSRALSSAGFVIIDTLTLASICTGLLPLFVSAAAVNSAFVLGCAINSFVKAEGDSKNMGEHLVDGFSYLALMGMSVGTAIASAELATTKVTHSYTITNNSNVDEYVYGHNGLREVIHPGETRTLVDHYTLYGRHGPGGDSIRRIFISPASKNSRGYYIKPDANASTYQAHYTQHGLKSSGFITRDVASGTAFDNK